MKVFQELAFYSHTTFKAHLLGLLGQHILEVRSAENDEENQKIILPEFAEFFSEVRSAEKENENGILKMENEYDTKTFGEKLFYEVENTYACLTLEAHFA